MSMLYCNRSYYYPITRWCLEEILGMKNYYLNVNNCFFLGTNNGEFSPPECVYISNDLKQPEEFRVLFHEIRHYFQFKTGMYKINDFITGSHLSKLLKDMSEMKSSLEQQL